MNRKDDHIQEALKQEVQTNDFDRVRFVPLSLPTTNVDTIDTTIKVFNRIFPTPLYINAMTGGTKQAYSINKNLARLAKTFNMPMASGSLSAGIKDSGTLSSYTVIREENKDGFIIANIGISAPIDYAQKAVEILNADALQVHINAPQEVVMPEGDRNFSFWRQNLRSMRQTIKVPVIAKEVGFGMSQEMYETLTRLGIHYADVSGKGGTNFISIENTRRDTPLETFEDYGFSTVESLLEATRHHSDIEIFASGGIRNAFDVVKALALGARAVGMSGYFLKLVTENTFEEAKAKVETLILDVKKIMAVLNCPSIEVLRQKDLILDQTLEHFLLSRLNHTKQD